MADTGMTITLRADGGAVLADLALLERAADLSLQVRQRLVDLFRGDLELLRVDGERGAAAPTGELRICFQLCDPLLELVAAIRAGHFEGVVVQDRFHG